ncbi:MAG: HAMP domain-containing histidine kinase [Labilithrix sp.]|nr:HAMP domain-containing histidine kinase [Labilithrix sp.]MCW5810428.1 HAMP domain-containing histidine kinase [Labilithrix sp.]
MGMTSELEVQTARRRARFEAERRRVFTDMATMTSRWRLALVAPFHALVIALLAVHGFPRDRLAIQIAASGTMILGFLAVERTYGRRNQLMLFLCGTSILVAIGNTGGLASPLLLSLMPFMVGVAMSPELENRRRHFVGKFLVVFGIMAWFARSYMLPEPLWGAGPFATREYVTIAFASAVMSLIAVYNIGKTVTGAYERLTLELAERREELCDENEGRTRALEGIAARLAHEVKNPLAAIKGLSTHMARSAEDAKMKERLAIVASEAERLQEIVDGFLSFSRGLDELNVAETKPYDIARELSTLLETRANDAGVALEVRGSRELSLDADAKKLRQALLNLVLNAMQASSKGSTVTIEVAKSCGDGAAILRVIDRGTGMAPEVLERIRKPYFTTKDGGSGLGIAIARGIVEQHGGTLDFESKRGRGTSAIVRLPAHAHGKEKLPNPCRYAAAAVKPVVDAATAPADPATPAPAFASAEKVPS